MGKVRRGGYVFLSWKGDHGPNDVHVYRKGRLLVKWDLEAQLPMRGKVTQRVRQLLDELQAEGRL
jgi:hypothetical protein